MLWTIVWLIFFISTAMEILRDFQSGSSSIQFYDGIKQLISCFFYIYIGIILFKFVFNREVIGLYLVSEKGLRRVQQLWLALFSLLAFKFFYINIVSWFILAHLEHVQHAELLGYDFQTGLKPFTDLFIATVIVWAFNIVLRLTVEFKKENDLTI